MAEEMRVDAGLRELGDLRPIPAWGEVGDEGLGEALKAFQGLVVEHLEALRKSCESARELQFFEARQGRNERRARMVCDLSVDSDTGEVDPTVGDGHAELGVTMGWTARANRNAMATLKARELRDVRRPYSLTPRGDRDENRMAVEIFEPVIDALLRKARFAERYGDDVLQLVPRHGTAVARYEWGTKSVWVEDEETGELTERISMMEPRFQSWPLDRVLVTDQDCRSAEDQRGVIWLTPNATLERLEAEEALEQVDEAGEVLDAGGKFRNLELLRALEEDVAPEPGARDTNSQVRGPRVGSRPTFTLVEYEGSLPFPHWVAKGRLTPEVAKALGLFVPGDLNEGDEGELLAWGRRLGQVRVWQVAFLSDWSASGVEAGHVHSHLVRLEADRSRRGRTSLFKFAWQLDGARFYGRSIADLGSQLEDAADCILNADLWTNYYNSHPGKILNKRVLKNKMVEEVAKLLGTPDYAVEGDWEEDVSKLVHFLRLPEVKEAIKRIEALRWDFEQATGVSAAAKGTDRAGGTGTLGEIQVNEGKADLEMTALVESHGREIARFVTCLLEDALHYLSEEEFIRFVQRVSGKARADIERVLPRIDTLGEELGISHPEVSGTDPVVLGTGLLKVFSAVPMAFPDLPRFAAKVMELWGLKGGEELVGLSESMSPEDEHGQMGEGNWVDPMPNESFEEHLPTHQAQLEADLWALKSGEADESVEVRVQILPGHMAKTVQLMQLKLQLDEARGLEAGGSVGGTAPGRAVSGNGGGGGGGGGRSGGAEEVGVAKEAGATVA